MTSDAKEWRVTRPSLYTGDCPGRDNPSARQGHYILAATAEGAALAAAEEFEDICFDVQPWRPVQGPAVRIAVVRQVKRKARRG